MLSAKFPYFKEVLYKEGQQAIDKVAMLDQVELMEPVCYSLEAFQPHPHSLVASHRTT